MSLSGQHVSWEIRPQTRTGGLAADFRAVRRREWLRCFTITLTASWSRPDSFHGVDRDIGKDCGPTSSPDEREPEMGLSKEGISEGRLLGDLN